jgi:hypothetical protein
MVDLGMLIGGAVLVAGWWISAALRQIADALDDLADAHRENADAVDGIGVALQGFVDKIEQTGYSIEDTAGEA